MLAEFCDILQPRSLIRYGRTHIYPFISSYRLALRNLSVSSTEMHPLTAATPSIERTADAYRLGLACIVCQTLSLHTWNGEEAHGRNWLAWQECLFLFLQRLPIRMAVSRYRQSVARRYHVLFDSIRSLTRLTYQEHEKAR